MSYIFIASMDVDSDKEDLFNEVYDAEHIPNLLKVPGVRGGQPLYGGAARRPDRRRAQASGARGAEVLRGLRDREPRSPVEPGVGSRGGSRRWPGEVRPYTRNRRHELRKRR